MQKCLYWKWTIFKEVFHAAQPLPSSAATNLQLTSPWSLPWFHKLGWQLKAEPWAIVELFMWLFFHGSQFWLHGKLFFKETEEWMKLNVMIIMRKTNSVFNVTPSGPSLKCYAKIILLIFLIHVLLLVMRSKWLVLVLRFKLGLSVIFYDFKYNTERDLGSNSCTEFNPFFFPWLFLINMLTNLRNGYSFDLFCRFCITCYLENSGTTVFNSLKTVG